MKLLSKCCGTEIKLGESGDFADDICTRYYICINCNQPCDVEEPTQDNEPSPDLGMEEEQLNDLTLCDSCMCMTKTILRNIPRLVCGKCLAGKVPMPMGVSEWKNHGIKYGYWDYFKNQILKTKSYGISKRK